MLWTFGAPLTVPTGNAARRTSQPVKWSCNSPVTFNQMNNALLDKHNILKPKIQLSKLKKKMYSVI